MSTTQQINELISSLTKRLVEALPPGLAKLPKELEKNFQSILRSAFHKMDLVTREEFDAQIKVLARTRKKLEELEKKVFELNPAGFSELGKTKESKKSESKKV